MSTIPKLDPSIHPIPPPCDCSVAHGAPEPHDQTCVSVRESRYAAGIAAERSRLLANPVAALDLLCHAIGENPVLVATVRGLVTPHLPPVKP